jgi:hypothetical protein
MNKLLQKSSPFFNRRNIQALKKITRKSIRCTAILTATIVITTEVANAQRYEAKEINPLGLTASSAGMSEIADIDGDGDFDLCGLTSYYENIGTVDDPMFGATQTTLPGAILGVGNGDRASYVDIDGDGDLDRFETGGDEFSDRNFIYQENIGNATSPSFGPIQTNPFGMASYPNTQVDANQTFIDLDADGDLDLFFISRTWVFYNENTGTPTTPVFGSHNVYIYNYISGLTFNSHPTFADFDYDGDLDLLVGGSPEHDYFENTGTNTAAVFGPKQTNPFRLAPSSYTPLAFDYDNDGDVDIMTRSFGAGSSHFGYYENNTVCSTLDQTVTAAQSMVCINGDATTIDLGNSELGLFYYLRNNGNDSIVSGPIPGTGTGISLPTGEIYATTTYNVLAARHSNSLEFDGVNDEVVIPDSPSLQLTNSLTLEAWVNFNDFSSFPAIMSKNDDPGYIVWVNNSSGQVNARIGGVEIVGGNITLNKWHHVAVTFDGTTKSIYIDGILTGSIADATPAATGTSSFNIGNWCNVNLNLDGKVDEVRVWNVSRSPSEIWLDMNNCLSGSEPGLAAYYTFEEAPSTSTLADLTANGNNGVLSNMDVHYVWRKGVPNCSYLCAVQMNDLATVVLGDIVDPTAICQDITIYLDGSNNATITANDIDGGSSDLCGIASIVASKTSFDCSNVGVNNVTLTITDNFSNTADCIAQVTVLDTINPSITTLAGASFEYPAGFNTAVVAVNTPQDAILDPSITGTSTALDNCTTVSVDYQDVLSAATPGTCPTIRTVTRTWTATDGSGNTISFDQVFILTDNTVPVITCPADITITNDAGNCGIDGTSITLATATDNHDPSVVITNDAPTFIPVGTTTVIWTATDVCGNSSQCSQLITVTDNENPQTVVLADIVENCVANVTAPTTTDNCSGIVVGTTTDPVNYSTQGTFVINWTFDDGNGNSINVPQNVTIQSGNTTGIDIVNECGNFYTWMDGVTYISDNNTATFTLPNTAGCDSIITLNLTFLSPATGTDVQTACSQYTWIDGNTYASANNTATYTFNGGAANGCDSIVTLDLTFLVPATSTDIQTACTQYTWMDGNVYASSNNTATHVLSGAASNGCDSIVTLDLTIINGTSGVDTRTECDAIVWLDGNTYSSDNNSATYTITGGAANGCDSLVTLNLTIIKSSVSTDVIEACLSYTWIDGNTYTSDNASATHVIPNTAGCDSTITLDLTIKSVDVSVTNNAPTLTANETGATYQWIDCDNGDVVIANETAATFTPLVNGNYAVIVTKDNCTDTSACELVNNVGIDELIATKISLYPNPTNNGRFIVQYDGQIQQITVMDLSGRIVNVSIDLSTGEVNASNLLPGKYFVNIQTNLGQTVKTVLIAR